MSNNAVTRPGHVPEERVIDLDIYAPPGARDDFHGAWKALQEKARFDVVWTPHNGGHWLVTRADLIPAVLSDYKQFSSRVLFVPKAMGQHHQLLPSTMDPPGHRHYRNLLNEGLSMKAVSGLEASIRELAIELIESFRADGHCDFSTAYAEQFPIRIFMRLVDLPIEDAAKIKHWADQTTRPDGSMKYEDAIQAFADYLEPWFDARHGGSGTDLISKLINGQVNGRPLTREEGIKMCSQALIAGLDTVVNLLSFVMLFLARNPDVTARLVADPALIGQSLDELIRRFGVVTVAREITTDTGFEGVTLKRGEMIVVPTMLQGLDETLHPDAMSVQPERPAIHHTTFGSGAHRCPGAHLGRTELRITLEEWLSRIPEFTVADDAQITFTAGVVGCVDRLPLIWKS